MKIHLVYDRPWWRSVGLTGSAVSDTGTARLTFDVRPPAGAGVLVTFLGLPAIDDPGLLHPDAAAQRRRRVLADLSGATWSAGCSAGGLPRTGLVPRALAERLPASPPARLLSRQHAWLTRPIGRLHWAGAESSYRWEGHMDGAVRSAHRTSTEVLTALKQDPQDCDRGS